MVLLIPRQAEFWSYVVSEKAPASEILLALLKDLGASSASGAAESTKSGQLVPAKRSNAPVAAEHDVPPERQRPYLPEVYEAERDIGLRRNSGANKLKRLKPRHKQVIALHLAGWESQRIAEKLDLTVAWVSTVLSDPLAREVISNFDELHEEEFKRLRVLANDAIRRALHPDKPDSTRLKAARMFHQRESELGLKDKGETAEDVMAKILQKIEAENVQINFNLGNSGNGQS